MRAVVEKDLTPEEAVKAYHDQSEKAGFKPTQTLAKDREITDPPAASGSASDDVAPGLPDRRRLVRRPQQARRDLAGRGRRRRDPLV